MEFLLGSYRVLDLSEEMGWLCGKIFSDLGADVIKIEPVGGDPARNIGPFYHGIPGAEKSLGWFAYNTNKRGITLNIETEEGQGILRRLAKTADFIIESFPPGYLDSLGLGYSRLNEINPELIMVSITPFGQSGPYKDYKATDIVAWAMGGMMYISGDSDRPPVRVSVEQACLHAASQAAAAAMIALHWKESGGEGQYIDVSVQECVNIVNFPEMYFWDTIGYLAQRSGARRHHANITQRDVWPCKDGHFGWRLFGGRIGAKTNAALEEWMDEEGMAGFLKEVKDWQTFDLSKMTQEEADRWEEQFVKFFSQHTKSEIFERAIAKKMHISPGFTPKELLEYEQLVDRSYWTQVEYPELNSAIVHPGDFCKFSETPLQRLARAPLIGEHNKEIYEKELGFSKNETILLRERSVI